MEPFFGTTRECLEDGQRELYHGDLTEACVIPWAVVKPLKRRFIYGRLAIELYTRSSGHWLTWYVPGPYKEGLTI